MKKIILLVCISLNFAFAQKFYVERVFGTVKVQMGSSEKWISLKEGTELLPYSTISTEEKSSVVLVKENIKFILKEISAINVSNIKPMSIDELLLALAMEDMISTPRKKTDNKSRSTQVYGNPIGSDKTVIDSGNDFGLLRLNGAKQLAESGFKESAVVAARETFRKYPDTKKLIPFRIYFANLLYEKGLFEEAYEDFKSFKDFSMTEKEKSEINSKLELLSTRLLVK